MTGDFVEQVNEMCREAALAAVVQTWRDLQGMPAGERVIAVYANSSTRAVEDLVVLRGRIDAALAAQGSAA